MSLKLLQIGLKPSIEREELGLVVCTLIRGQNLSSLNHLNMKVPLAPWTSWFSYSPHMLHINVQIPQYIFYFHFCEHTRMTGENIYLSRCTDFVP